MAERWLHCAEVFQRESSAVQPSKRHHRAAADTHH
jgi:hypothetical protein